MRPRDIIARAWAITKKEPALRRWGFLSAIFETLLSVKFLAYQIYFWYTFVEGNPIDPLTIETILFHTLPLWFFLTITTTFITLIVIEIFLPSMCLGAIIGLAAKSQSQEEVKGGLVLAIYNFLPLFVIKEIFILASTTTMLTGMTFVLRYGGEDGLRFFFLGALFLFWVLSLLFRALTSFAEEAVVIRKEGIFQAMSTSFKIVISHLSQIVFLLLLLFVISLRILINAAMVLLLPSIVIGLSLLLSLIMPPVATYIVSSIVGLILIGIASYFFAYLHVFKQTVWTLTYMKLSSKKDLDIITVNEETPLPPPESQMAAAS